MRYMLSQPHDDHKSSLHSKNKLSQRTNPHSSPRTYILSYNGQLRGCNLERLLVWRQAGKSLLLAVWPDQGVDLDRVDVVHLLQRVLDLPLVGLDVDDEDERVVLLDLLHRALRVERVQDDLVLVQARLVVECLAWVLWFSRQVEHLWAPEGGGWADFSHFGCVDLRRQCTLLVELDETKRKLTPRSVAFAAALAFAFALPADLPADLPVDLLGFALLLAG